MDFHSTHAVHVPVRFEQLYEHCSANSNEVACNWREIETQNDEKKVKEWVRYEQVNKSNI